jgi:hypothetical protein
VDYSALATLTPERLWSEAISAGWRGALRCERRSCRRLAPRAERAVDPLAMAAPVSQGPLGGRQNAVRIEAWPAHFSDDIE